MPISKVDQSVNRTFIRIIPKVNANSNAKFNVVFVGGLVGDPVNVINRVNEGNFELSYEIGFGCVSEFALEFAQ